MLIFKDTFLRSLIGARSALAVPLNLLFDSMNNRMLPSIPSSAITSQEHCHDTTSEQPDYYDLALIDFSDH